MTARAQLACGLLVVSMLAGLAGLAAGSQGWSISSTWGLFDAGDASLVLGEIRLPRTLGAWLVGALLGLSGALAQGLFRNPLADPFLLGSASGAVLGVVVVLASGTLIGHGLDMASVGWLARAGLAGAAFTGATGGVLLTLSLARGAQQTMRLLLAGVVVGVMLSAASDLITTAAPEALRGKQAFLMGSTGYLGWQSCGVLAFGLMLALPLAWRFSRALDALSLGEDSAASLGLAIPRIRVVLVAALALATGLAVSQAGLVAFVGLVSPHLVRRFVTATHGYIVIASAAMGGALLLAADLLARSVVAPQELPVGLLTAVLGGGYLLWMLHKGRAV